MYVCKNCKKTFEYRKIYKRSNGFNVPGIVPLNCSKKCRYESTSKSQKGKPHLDKRGENHYNWQGGKGEERHQAMRKIEYTLWRTAIFMRDDYTCQKCLKRGGNMEADHIKPWALYPELRYAIDNGRTLCVYCHRQTETWGRTSIYRKAVD